MNGNTFILVSCQTQSSGLEGLYSYLVSRVGMGNSPKPARITETFNRENVPSIVPFRSQISSAEVETMRERAKQSFDGGNDMRLEQFSSNDEFRSLFEVIGEQFIIGNREAQQRKKDRDKKDSGNENKDSNHNDGDNDAELNAGYWQSNSLHEVSPPTRLASEGPMQESVNEEEWDSWYQENHSPHEVTHFNKIWQNKRTSMGESRGGNGQRETQATANTSKKPQSPAQRTQTLTLEELDLLKPSATAYIVKPENKPVKKKTHRRRHRHRNRDRPLPQIGRAQV